MIEADLRTGRIRRGRDVTDLAVCCRVRLALAFVPAEHAELGFAPRRQP